MFWDENEEITNKIDQFVEAVYNEARKNAELDHELYMRTLEQKVKNMEDKCNKYDALVKENERIKKECEETVKNLKKRIVDEIFDEIGKPIYSIRYESIGMGPKCNLCDEHRRLWHTFPNGQKVNISCDCAKIREEFKVYPAQQRLYSNKLADGKPILFNVKIGAYNYVNVNEDTVFGEDVDFDSFIKRNKKDEVQLAICSLLFKTEEGAKQFADKLNQHFKAMEQ